MSKNKAGLTAILATGFGILLSGFTTRRPPVVMIAPVNGPIHPQGRFNTMRSGGIHGGTDVVVPVGTPVKSPFPGKIQAVYYNSEGGNQVLIVHPNGFVTGYAHLSKVFLSPGTIVIQGQVFALSGNSGHSTGPHLHFTLRRASDGVAIDPEKYFKFSL